MPFLFVFHGSIWDSFCSWQFVGKRNMECLSSNYGVFVFWDSNLEIVFWLSLCHLHSLCIRVQTKLLEFQIHFVNLHSSDLRSVSFPILTHVSAAWCHIYEVCVWAMWQSITPISNTLCPATRQWPHTGSCFYWQAPDTKYKPSYAPANFINHPQQTQ